METSTPEGAKGNTADGKTVATVAVILRVDATGVEVEVVSVVSRVRRTRPVVAVRADIVQRAIVVIVVARELKPERMGVFFGPYFNFS